mmetsp:Transcript_17841/g.35820  ORF Transcript_17841/g.35820 Transcript_17841/m.35820 type:complete len:244 (+) Transcript_17841:4610-5341(+)
MSSSSSSLGLLRRGRLFRRSLPSAEGRLLPPPPPPPLPLTTEPSPVAPESVVVLLRVRNVGGVVESPSLSCDIAIGAIAARFLLEVFLLPPPLFLPNELELFDPPPPLEDAKPPLLPPLLSRSLILSPVSNFICGLAFMTSSNELITVALSNKLEPHDISKHREELSDALRCDDDVVVFDNEFPNELSMTLLVLEEGDELVWALLLLTVVLLVEVVVVPSPPSFSSNTSDNRREERASSSPTR